MCLALWTIPILFVKVLWQCYRTTVTRSEFLVRVLVILMVFLSDQVLHVVLEFQFGSVFCVGIFLLCFPLFRSFSSVPLPPSVCGFCNWLLLVLSGPISKSSYLNRQVKLRLRKLLESWTIHCQSPGVALLALHQCLLLFGTTPCQVPVPAGV